MFHFAADIRFHINHQNKKIWKRYNTEQKTIQTLQKM